MTTYTSIPTTDADANSPFDEDLLQKIAENPLAWAEDDSTSPFSPTDVSPHFLDQGSDSNGAVVLSGGTILRGAYNCTSFTIDAGQVVIVQDEVVIVRATSQITINGTLRCTRKNPTNSNNDPIKQDVNQILMGGSGGAGGDVPLFGFSTKNGGDTFGLPGGAGMVAGVASVPGPGLDRPLSSSGAAHGDQAVLSLGPIAWYGGGNGSSGETIVNAGLGGIGGGCIILISPSIIVSVTGTISVAGEAGGNATGADNGGGGGGGGGIIVSVSQSAILSQPGTVTAAGGLGGVGTGSALAGGNGGAGRVIDLVL